ncbi:hypothetical protein [Halomonas sp. SL1]|uniref:hypothetical protein n=1 Tax=Halomonas sp. SL1 TaxID=2137478 RepID=UPI0011B94609|nr:hypothetical protein [Halomonas sp. SL1]
MTDIDFRKTYRVAKRKNLLSKGSGALQEELRTKHPSAVVKDDKINSFTSIHGYRVTIGNNVGFFPKDLNDNLPITSAHRLRNTFYEAGLIVPPFFMNSFLLQQGDRLRLSEDKEAAARKILTELYTPESISILFIEKWSKLTTFYQYKTAIEQSIRCYFSGLLYAAVITIIPCIEGIVRELGVMKGGKEDEVGSKDLIRVVKKICNEVRERLFSGYTWYPESEITIDYLDQGNEQVQMLKNLSLFFEKQLYEHSSNLPKNTLLNRHNIVHGLSFESINDASYLRLINMLNSLSFASILAGVRASSFFPPSSPESEAFLSEIEADIIRRQVKDGALKLQAKPY